jgi:hypothetical protein
MNHNPRIIQPKPNQPQRDPYTLDDLVEMAHRTPIIGVPQPKEVPGLAIPIEDDGLILYALCLYADENLQEIMSRLPVRGTPTGMADHVKKMINLFEKVFEAHPSIQDPLTHRKFYIEPCEKEEAGVQVSE